MRLVCIIISIISQASIDQVTVNMLNNLINENYSEEKVNNIMSII